jgi:hypothetical protein
VKIAVLSSGAFGQKLIRHFSDVEGFCTGCPDCIQCRQHYDLDYSRDLAYIFEQPGNLPMMLDDAEEYLPPASSLAGIHTVLAVNLHQDMLLSLPERLAEAGVKALVVPVEDPLWLQGGPKRQVEQKAKQLALEVSFPKPFCSLREDAAHPEINKFIRYFRIGFPVFRIKKENGVIREAEVVRSSPCGCAYFVAHNLEGVHADEKLDEFVSRKWHEYPCTASMKMDRELKDTILHLAGYLHREAVASAVKE